MRSPFRCLTGLALVLPALLLRGELANVAGDGIAYSDRPLWGGAPISRLNDSDTATVFHADTDDTPGLNYTLDLGQDRSIAELRIFPRQDNCCAERLRNFRVSVHAEGGGAPGAEVWGQTLHGDGTNPGSAPGTVVTLSLPSPQTGRWIKIEALDDPPSDYALQMTELQVLADVPADQINRALGKGATANQPLF
ncbi:MAG: discoidin domain-containing protein, partial [Verrucomicrobia bacterium]|nr:discoidin domain-containing protein [Verrucomicrobiota bacterium]